MNRYQLDNIVVVKWPQLKSSPYWAPELLGHLMWEKANDPVTWTLNQLYQEKEKFIQCLETNTDWPTPPGDNYPGNYYKDALDLMELIPDKEAWQYKLCVHFRELV